LKNKEVEIAKEEAPKKKRCKNGKPSQKCMSKDELKEYTKGFLFHLPQQRNKEKNFEHLFSNIIIPQM
jgi:hypothetical protein